jgi:hypothetical protein
MGGSIPPGAFGVIELLVVLAFILILALTLLRTHSSKMPAEFRGVEAQLHNDLDAGAGARLTRILPDALKGTNKAGDFEYLLEGDAPDRRLLRVGSQGRVTLVERVVYLGFSAFDADRHYLGDELGAEKAGLTDELRVEIRTHQPKEDATFFLADGVRGVDLDKDLSNGVAHVSSLAFSLHVGN